MRAKGVCLSFDYFFLHNMNRSKQFSNMKPQTK